MISNALVSAKTQPRPHPWRSGTRPRQLQPCAGSGMCALAVRQRDRPSCAVSCEPYKPDDIKSPGECQDATAGCHGAVPCSVLMRIRFKNNGALRKLTDSQFLFSHNQNAKAVRNWKYF